MKKLIKNLSIQGKLIVVILLTTGIALSLTALGIMFNERAQTRQAIVDDLATMAKVLGGNSAAALSFNDVAAATEILSAISAKPWSLAGELYLADGTLFTRYTVDKSDSAEYAYCSWTELELREAQSSSGLVEGQCLCISRPIFLEGKRIGSILLETDLRELDERLYSSAKLTGIIMGISFLVAIWLAIRLQHLISRPVLQLTHTMADVAETHDYTRRARKYGEDELGQLVDGFNNMIEQVHVNEKALAQHNAELESKVEDRTAELMVSKEAAEAASEAKSRFLATMSHEIRTPLNGVVGMLKLLRNSSLDNRQRRYVTKGVLSSEALLAVINDILDFSKVEAGKMEIEHLQFNLVDVIENAVQMFAQQAEEKGLELACMIDAKVPRVAMGDPNRIAQVLINLIGNAVKFTLEGDIAVRVFLEAEEDQQVVARFEVKDSGIGISQQHQERIFEPFLQQDNSTTRRFGGTGLGLGISRQLVALMGGSIGVDSEQGMGSTFQFTICLGAAPVEALPKRLNGMSGLHGLIVDDHEINREIIACELECWGCTTGQAGNGEAALKLLHEQSEGGTPFDFAVVDWNMPGMNGEELCRQIKRTPDLAEMPLILLSSVGGIDASRLQEIGLASALSKPVRQSELHDAIMNAVNHVEVPVHKKNPAAPVVLPDAGHVRILLAEDNEINREVACEILSVSGYSCDVACNGREAIEAAEKTQYDLIFMDCMMPELDGYGATGCIRRREQTTGRHVPIIALTANAMKGDREQCLASGMDDYLSKPLDPAEVIGMIGKWYLDTDVTDQPAFEPEWELQEADALAMFDREAVLKRCMGNEDLVDKLIAKFMQQLGDDMRSLGQGLSASDGETVYKTAHRIKGAAANLSMETVRGIAASVEGYGRTDNIEEAATGFRDLSAEIVRVKQHLTMRQTAESA